MKNKAVIIGSGTYGQVYAEFLNEEYNILGFIDDDLALHGHVINEIKVLGDFDYLLNEITKDTLVFVPLGDNYIRTTLIRMLREEGFQTPSYIHPDALISESVELGKTVYILPGTQIMPLSKIGDFVMISMGVNIAHHTMIGEGAFLSQGTNVGASVNMLPNAFCGIGSTVMTGVNYVGLNAFIGAGSMVIKDVPDYAVVVGNPSRIIKFNENPNSNIKLNELL